MEDRQVQHIFESNATSAALAPNVACHKWNWNFVRLGSLVVKCPGCCTDVVGSIPGPDTCDRQRLGQELHWWHYSQKCVGLVCPPQLP